MTNVKFGRGRANNILKASSSVALLGWQSAAFCCELSRIQLKILAQVGATTEYELKFCNCYWFVQYATLMRLVYNYQIHFVRCS